MCHRPVLVEFFGVALLLHCSAAFHMFYYSVVFQLFCQYSIVLPVFQCSVKCSIVLPVFPVL